MTRIKIFKDELQIIVEWKLITTDQIILMTDFNVRMGKEVIPRIKQRQH